MTLAPNRAYAALDWLATTLSANETADLTDRSAWTLARPAASPAATHAAQLMQLFGTEIRAEYELMVKLAGPQAGTMVEAGAAVYGGLGGLYAMEGVPVRERHAGGRGLVRTRLLLD